MPADWVLTYLDRWRDSFWLFDDANPFMQAPGIRYADGESRPVSLLMEVTSPGSSSWWTRSGDGLRALTYAETARWLVYDQAYDLAGIKGGAVIGDPRGKGGKRMGCRPGLAGCMAATAIEGRSLAETILLNMPLGRGEDLSDAPYSADLPAWERDPLGPAEVRRMPDGPADLRTWRSRAILLHDAGDGYVDGVTMTVGEVINQDGNPLTNMRGAEDMCCWFVPQSSKKKNAEPRSIPVPASVDRAPWRGLASLLAEDAGEQECPGTVSWLRHVADATDAALPDTLCARTVGLVFTDDKRAKVKAEMDDVLVIPARLLSSCAADARALAREVAAEADEMARAAVMLLHNVSRASGGDGTIRGGAASDVYGSLWPAYRTWLGMVANGLPDFDEEKARESWQRAAWRWVTAVEDGVMSEAPVDAIRGHGEMTLGAASKIFRARVAKAVEDEGGNADAKETEDA